MYKYAKTHSQQLLYVVLYKLKSLDNGLHIVTSTENSTLCHDPLYQQTKD